MTDEPTTNDTAKQDNNDNDESEIHSHKPQPKESSSLTTKAASSALSSKKRKRGDNKKKGSKPTLLEIQQERYDKLLYQAKKQLHKQAKQVRTFLTQKTIRKSQQQQQSQKKETNTDVATETKTATAANTPKNPWKDLPLDQVVHQALKQLGILHANPNPEAPAPTPAALDKATTTKYDKLIQTCLAHKRFQNTLEDWNVKVTEYRRWSLQLEERFNGNKRPTTSNGGSNDFMVNSRQQQQYQPTSMFCNLGGGEGNDGEDNNPMSAYGPAASYMEDPFMVKKKNRKGQRARKAKALALQAKREGKEYQSLNWRSGEKKNKNGDDEHDTNNRKRQRYNDSNSFEHNNKSKSAPNNKNEAPPEAAHPSWVAKKEQPTGIVAFQGTKITFD